MMFVYGLKATFALASLAVSELIASGQLGVALAAALPLVLLFKLTRRYDAARRRAPEDVE